MSLWWKLLLIGLSVSLFLLAWQPIVKLLIQQFFRSFAKILMTDSYDENLMEFYSAIKRSGFQRIMEINLRAQDGKVLERPLGSTRQFLDFTNLMLNGAQLSVLPTEPRTPVDTKVIVGPNAERPLILDIPIVIGGMAYGFALSEKAKIALAKGTALAGTATNTGSGPFIQSERDSAKYLILQLPRAPWNRDPAILRQADAIELQFGQGASFGYGYKMEAKDIDEKLRQAFGIPPGSAAEVSARQPGVSTPNDIIELVGFVRSQVAGIPVGIKMGATFNLEADLEIALKAGVDFITLCGAQGGTHGMPPPIMDSIGLPSLIALSRAVRYLESRNAKDKLTLIMDGGFADPGEMLRALALGANAISIGTAALFAISHTQILKSLPWEPPTQIVWYNAKQAAKYDENQGAQSLAKYLNACSLEIADGLRVNGKTSLAQISKADLFAIDKTTSEIVGVPLAYTPQTTAAPRTRILSKTKSGISGLESDRQKYAKFLIRPNNFAQPRTGLKGPIKGGKLPIKAKYKYRSAR